MAANLSPIFVLTPVIGQARISTANTARDGSGTLGTLLTGGTNGTRVELIQIKGTVTTSAGMIRLFLDFGGGTIRLLDEIVVDAITVGAAVAAFLSSYIPPVPLVLPSGVLLKVGTQIGEQFDVTAWGGDY